MGERATTLVIADGGPASLLACWVEGVCRPAVGEDAAARLQASREGICVFVPGSVGEAAAAAVERFAEVCHAPATGVVRGVRSGRGEVIEVASKVREGLATTELLWAACTEALRRKIHRVVWPVQLGGPNVPTDQINVDELDLVSDAFDRAVLCARLVAVDAGPRGMVIETPYIDFTDAQVMDLAADLDAPVNLAWWCVEKGEEGRGCGTCRECLRWSQAMLEAGLHFAEGLEVRVPGASNGAETKLGAA